MIELAERYCPKCGKELAPDANFCPNCGAIIARQGAEKPRKSGLVTAGGILTIAAACIAAFDGFVAIAASLISLSFWYTSSYVRGYFQTLVVVGFFALIGFAFGLAAGIQFLRRKQFVFAMVGTSLLMLSGFVNFFMPRMPYSGYVWALMFGLPIVFLSLLGLVFVATRKREFD